MAIIRPNDKVTTQFATKSGGAEEKLNEYSTSESLTFPSRLTQEWNHIMHFRRYEYSRTDARTDAKAKAVGGKIALPVPQDLSVAYAAEWQNESLGLVGNAMQDELGKAINIFKNTKGDTASRLKESLQTFTTNEGGVGKTVANIGVAWGIDAVAGSLLGQVASKASGLAVNPFKAVLYNAPNLRTFQFSYKFIPSNMQEAETIRKISREFKLGMHPDYLEGYKDNIFKYPDIWKIEIPNPKYLFKFVDCVLTQANFNFHGEGTKTYLRNDGGESIPLSVQVSLGFQEVSILTKKEISEGY